MNLPLADKYVQVLSVLDQLSKGMPVTRACDEQGISIATFKHYVANIPDLKQYYEDCEQRGYDALADVLLDIRGHPFYGSTNPQEQKVLSENIKWILARRRPLQFGDRMTVDHNHNITADKAIVEALSKGRERAESAVVDAAYVVVEDTVRLTVEDAYKEFL